MSDTDIKIKLTKVAKLLSGNAGGDENGGGGSIEGVYFYTMGNAPTNVPPGSLGLVPEAAEDLTAVDYPSRASVVQKATAIIVNRADFFTAADAGSIVEGTYKITEGDRYPRAATEQEMEEYGIAYVDMDAVKITVQITKTDNDSYTLLFSCTYFDADSTSPMTKTDTVYVNRGDTGTDYYSVSFHSEEKGEPVIPFYTDANATINDVYYMNAQWVEPFQFSGYRVENVTITHIKYYTSMYGFVDTYLTLQDLSALKTLLINQ